MRFASSLPWPDTGPGPWAEIALDVEPRGRGAVVAVIAYLGRDAPELLRLRRGDTLICDASPGAVKSGSTDASALRLFQRRGVRVFSVEGLHAKVVLGPEWAWVGSANASASSQDHLVEASVRVTSKRTLSRIGSWSDSLQAQGHQLHLADIVELQAIPVQRRASVRRREFAPLTFPDETEPLCIVFSDRGVSPATQRAAADQRSSVRQQLRQQGLSAPLAFMEWSSDTCPLRQGSWLIDVGSGQPRRPERIEKITQPGVRRFLIWLAAADTPRRPSLSQFLEAVGWEREALGADEAVRLPARARRAVLDLYR